MVRVITQETYDEVVKENIEEFDMTPQEAIAEAVAQFEAQVNYLNLKFYVTCPLRTSVNRFIK